MNHRPLCEVEWQAGVSDVGLSVLKGLDAGQEVCNNYGPKSNEQREFDRFPVAWKSCRANTMYS